MLFFNMPQVTFFVRSNNDAAQSSVLYCRITIRQQTAEFSTKEKIERRYWDQRTQTYKPKNKVARQYYAALIDSLRFKIKTLSLIHPEGDLHPRTIIRKLTEKPQDNHPKLSELCETYIAELRGAASGTIRAHRIKLQNLIDYQNSCKEVFTTKTFSLAQANRFIEWFQNRADTVKVSTASRNVMFYKKAMEHAQQTGKLESYELAAFRPRHDKIEPPVYLTIDDVMKIAQHPFQSLFLSQCRDLFLFQVSTGLSFGDLYSGYRIDETPAGKVIQGKRSKNGQAYFVPLDDFGTAMLEKYQGKLPRYQNEPYNRALKEIAAITGINKRITTHTARKTFATLRDADGWSRESVAKMLGHRSVKTTETYYLGETFDRVVRELEQRKMSM